MSKYYVILCSDVKVHVPVLLLAMSTLPSVAIPPDTEVLATSQEAREIIVGGGGLCF